MSKLSEDIILKLWIRYTTTLLSGSYTWSDLKAAYSKARWEEVNMPWKKH